MLLFRVPESDRRGDRSRLTTPDWMLRRSLTDDIVVKERPKRERALYLRRKSDTRSSSHHHLHQRQERGHYEYALEPARNFGLGGGRGGARIACAPRSPGGGGYGGGGGGYYAPALPAAQGANIRIIEREVTGGGRSSKSSDGSPARYTLTMGRDRHGNMVAMRSRRPAGVASPLSTPQTSVKFRRTTTTGGGGKSSSRSGSSTPYSSYTPYTPYTPSHSYDSSDDESSSDKSSRSSRSSRSSKSSGSSSRYSRASSSTSATTTNTSSSASSNRNVRVVTVDPVLPRSSKSSSSSRSGSHSWSVGKSRSHAADLPVVIRKSDDLTTFNDDYDDYDDRYYYSGSDDDDAPPKRVHFH